MPFSLTIELRYNKRPAEADFIQQQETKRLCSEDEKSFDCGRFKQIQQPKSFAADHYHYLVTIRIEYAINKLLEFIKKNELSYDKTAEILNISDQDLLFYASVLADDEGLYDKYKKILQDALATLPGIINHQLQLRSQDLLQNEFGEEAPKVWLTHPLFYDAQHNQS